MCNLERDREGERKWEREESGGNPSEINRAKFCTHFYLLQEIYIKIHHLSFFGSTSGAPVQQQLSPAKQKKRYLHITNTKCEMHRLLQGLIFPKREKWLLQELRKGGKNETIQASRVGLSPNVCII